MKTTIVLLLILFLSSCDSLDTPTVIALLSTSTHTPAPTLSSTPNPVTKTPLPTQLTIVPSLNPTQVIQQEGIKSILQPSVSIIIGQLLCII